MTRKHLSENAEKQKVRSCTFCLANTHATQHSHLSESTLQVSI